MKRTDIHRPAAIVPSDYDWVSFDYLGGSDLGALLSLRVERERRRAHMERTGGRYTNHEHGGTCAVCGASASYVSIFYHRPSNEYLVVGWECAEKLELSSGPDASLFRAGIRDAREAQAGKRKARAVLADLGLGAAWDLADEPVTSNDRQILRDIVARLVKYGSLSEKQVAFLRTLTERVAREVERAWDQALAEEHLRQTVVPWAAGRQQVSGTFVSTRVVESDFGKALKGLFVTTEGRKLWLTVPAAINVPVKGLQATLRVTVQPKQGEPLFAFGSRPTLVSIDHTPEEAAQ